MLSIQDRIDNMYASISGRDDGGPFTRYKSWEYCHDKFRAYHDVMVNEERDLSPQEYDDLALNLAFYLASWGMYRGSSFLLQRDYRTHSNAVHILMDRRYDSLWDLNPQGKSDEELKQIASSLRSISNRIITSYGPILEKDIMEEENQEYVFFLNIGGKSKELIIKTKEDGEAEVSKGGKRSFHVAGDGTVYYRANKNCEYESLAFHYDDETVPENVVLEDGTNVLIEKSASFSSTLISKILLGSLACLPAYDRFFIAGLKQMNKQGNLALTASYHEKGFFALLKYVRDNIASFLTSDCPYPIMKKTDMLFWQTGYEIGFLGEGSTLYKLCAKEANGEELTGKETKAKRKLISLIRAFVFNSDELVQPLSFYQEALKQRNDWDD